MEFTVKSVISIFYFLFLSTNLQSQNSAIDSLKNKLLVHSEKDTIRVNLLNDLAFSYHETDFAKTIAYLEESEAISNALDFKKGLARSLIIKGRAQVEQSRLEKGYHNINEALQLYKVLRSKKGISECYSTLGLFFYRKEDQKQAIEYHQKSMDINQQLGNKKAISTNLGDIGKAYLELGNFVESISHFKRALDIDKEINDEEKISQNLGNIGVIYAYQGNHPLALEYYNKSIAIDEKRGDTIGIIAVLNNKGIVYQKMQNYDQAVAHYLQALNMQKKYGNKQNMADILINLGFVYKQKKEYKSANDYLKEALVICKEINYKSGEAFTLNNMGNVFLEQGRLEQALQNFEQAKTINLSVDNKLGLCVSFLGLAQVYTGQKKNKKALANALESKEISNKSNFMEYQRDVSELLSEIYTNTGNFKRALENHQQFKILNDSIFNKENVEKIAQLEYEYKYKQALDSASIRELQLTKTVKTTSQDLEKSQRNSFIGIIAILLISIISGGFIFFLKLRNANAKNQNILIEQKLLRSQMTPHFMFNSLSVLQGMILNKNEEKSISYLSKFSKLLRTTLENSRHKTVALSQELSAIDSYMALQNLDVNPPINYNLSVDSQIDTATYGIPPMLIQPFIENAIEHAFVTKKEDKEIEVKIALNNRSLVCTIADNGVGVSTEKYKMNKNKKSLATTITVERLRMISKDFKVEGSVCVTNRQLSGEQGTLVTLVIPYRIDSV